MKNKVVKNINVVAATVLLAGCIMMVTACAPNTAEKGFEIDSIMQNERDTDSPILLKGIADKAVYGEGNYSLYDDLWEYVYDPDGYIVTAVRVHDKTSVIYDATSDNNENLETRAMNLHLRNGGKWLKGDSSITETVEPMGTISFSITDMQNGNPTGRMTNIIFSKGGALIALTFVNYPVSEVDLAQEVVISEDRAAEIAFADLMNKFGHVLENKEFSKAHWTTVKEAAQQRLVWTITIDQLTRTDFHTPTKKWSVIYKINVLTGEILQILAAS